MKKALRNYTFARAARSEELNWLRIDQFETISLPRPVVLVNGAFDLLHAGHMKVLFTARQHAKRGTVVCALDADAKIQARKGSNRPVQTWLERANALHYMPIDHICEIEDDKQFLRLVKLIKPDLRVLGAEYQDKKSRIPGVQCVLARDSGVHSSDLIERIHQKCKLTK